MLFLGHVLPFLTIAHTQQSPMVAGGGGGGGIWCHSSQGSILQWLLKANVRLGESSLMKMGRWGDRYMRALVYCIPNVLCLLGLALDCLKMLLHGAPLWCMYAWLFGCVQPSNHKTISLHFTGTAFLQKIGITNEALS